jgi:hypothetical protein
MRHDLLADIHFGFNKTMKMLSQDFWWSQMWKLVKEFIQSYDTCERGKVPQHQPYGLLHLLPVPKGPWLSLSMDFITDISLANGKDSIFVVVDWVTKMAHFILCTKVVTEEETTKLFLEYAYCIHGLPNDIVSNTRTQFTSNFWKRLFKLFSMKINLSTTYHPQIDGQIERMNQILEQ